VNYARLAGSVLGVALLVGCTLAPTKPSAEVLLELAPTGKLRVGMVIGNIPTPSLATRDPTTGAPRGVPVDLARDLAQQLGVPLEIVPYPTPARLFESVSSGRWDVTFLAVDPVREKDVDFSPPYTNIGNTFLVPAQSAIRSIAILIARAYAWRCRRKRTRSRTDEMLKNAQLVRAAGPSLHFSFSSMVKPTRSRMGARFYLVSPTNFRARVRLTVVSRHLVTRSLFQRVGHSPPRT